MDESAFSFDSMQIGLFATDQEQRTAETEDDFFADEESEEEEEEEEFSDEEVKLCRCGKFEEFKTETYSFCTNCGGIINEFNNYFENIKNEIAHSADKIDPNSTISLDFCVVSRNVLSEDGDYGETSDVLSLFDFILFQGDSLIKGDKENLFESQFIMAMIDRGFHFCSRDKVARSREEFKGISTYFCIFFNPKVVSINDIQTVRLPHMSTLPSMEFCISPLVTEFTHIKTQLKFVVINIFTTPVFQHDFKFFVKSNEIDAMGEYIRDVLLPKGYSFDQIIICGDINVKNTTELDLVLRRVQHYSGSEFFPLNYEMVVMNNNEKVKKPADQILISKSLLSEEMWKQNPSEEDSLFTTNTVYVHFHVPLAKRG